MFVFVICRISVSLLVMDEDPNQLIEAPEDDDINDLNDETFGSFVENCMQPVINFVHNLLCYRLKAVNIGMCCRIVRLTLSIKLVLWWQYF